MRAAAAYSRATKWKVGPVVFNLKSYESLFYDMNLSFSWFSSGISNVESVAGFDVIQPQFHALGLGFSSLSSGAGDDYRSGYSSSKRIHDIISSNSLLSNYSILGNTSSSSTANVSTPPPTIASLLASKLINGGSKDPRAPNNFHFLEAFDQDEHPISNEESEMGLKRVKQEAQNKLDWYITNSLNHSDQIGIYDPSVYWNSFVSTWHDPANIVSSLTSLI